MSLYNSGICILNHEAHIEASIFSYATVEA